MSDDQIKTLLSSNLASSTQSRIEQEEKSFLSLLSPIIKVRVPGTEGHEEVKNFIKGYMSSLHWQVSEDSFHGITPIGRKPFSNIIATQNPNAVRRLVFACHYDSKIDPQGFLGVSDSAVPCAMLLSLATSLNASLWTRSAQLGYPATASSENLINRQSAGASDSSSSSSSSSDSGSSSSSGIPLMGQSLADSLSLQFIFFDGEEAFVEWTRTDSIYGARHLASLWAKTPYTLPNWARTTCSSSARRKRSPSDWDEQDAGQLDNKDDEDEKITEIDRIDVLTLLDLIGPKDTIFRNIFSETENLFNQLVSIEKRLAQLSLLSSSYHSRTSRYGPYFANRGGIYGGIEDDHIPFLSLGVRVLHLISSPFPSVWHTLEDDLQHTDLALCVNLLRIFRIFLHTQLQLPLKPSALQSVDAVLTNHA